MDFKSLMSAQIARSKPPVSKSSSSPSPTPDSPASTAANKYVRRADLEASRQAEYLAEQARLSAEREERLSKKRKLEEEEAERNARREEKLRKLAEDSRRRREEEEKEEERRRRKRLGLPEAPDQPALEDGGMETGEAGTGETGEDIPDDELRNKLREINEPVTLFDEDHSARLRRYYTLTRMAVTASSQKLSNGPIPTTLEPVEEKDMLLPSTLALQPGTEEYAFLHRQLASYFTLLLTEWSHALAERDASVKQSSSGKAAYNSYLVVLKDLTPLFRHFEKQSLDRDLLEPICKIVRSAQKRRYVEANDEYLTLSIGKAAWPIGVTMVGIHERSAREKLHESSSGKQAHIMSDEVTRKFLQSIKRCISFAQTRWPPEDLGQLMG
ncbi:uncharacterized protein PV07_02765 [Cladophialophora immunda]|uniref:Pre-mRNA-splicing factor 18 n=1 Tax=Cladophialophora immunda TaxID=569365 RepID=A0A0D2CIX9_9EURO|nr:uncharacterized protein PV07_02765 [Cladophialophora immunda]KIW31083.1 hypothetical protein PV07_02765 [Cladophialophora immunda]